jgi:hypothetical protein
VSAAQAVDTAHALLSLVNADRDRIASLGRAAVSALAVHLALQKQRCLDDRLPEPSSAGPSCRPSVGGTIDVGRPENGADGDPRRIPPRELNR